MPHCHMEKIARTILVRLYGQSPVLGGFFVQRGKLEIALKYLSKPLDFNTLMC